MHLFAGHLQLPPGNEQLPYLVLPYWHGSIIKIIQKI